MKYDFNKVQDRIGSDSIKWEKQLKFGTKTGILPFWIADTDFATLPEAVEAMKKRLEHPVFGYTTTGERTLETVRGWYKRLSGGHAPPAGEAALRPRPGISRVRQHAEKGGNTHVWNCRIYRQPECGPHFAGRAEEAGI